MLELDSRLDRDLPIRLGDAVHHALRHVGGGVADVDLTASDVVLAAVQRGRSGQARDRVLRRSVRSRVRPRSVGGDGAVVDYPSTARLLVLHDLDRLLRAEKGAREIRVDDRFPLFQSNVFEGDWRSTRA